MLGKTEQENDGERERRKRKDKKRMTEKEKRDVYCLPRSTDDTALDSRQQIYCSELWIHSEHLKRNDLKDHKRLLPLRRHT